MPTRRGLAGRHRNPRSAWAVRSVAAGCASVVVVGLGLAACSSSTGPTTAATASPVYIGAILAQTGALAPNDLVTLQGEQAAVAYVNQHGGVAGHKLVLEVMDGQSSPTVGTTDAETLISKYSLSAVFVGESSTTTSAIQALASEHHVPVVAGSVLNSPTEPWEYQAGVSGSAEDDVASALGFAVNSLHAKSIAVLTSQTVYGQEDATAAATEAHRLGITIVANISAPATATSLAPQVGTIAAATPDVVVNMDGGSPEILLAQAMQEEGMKTPLIEISATVPFSAMTLYHNGPAYYLNSIAADPSIVSNPTAKTFADLCDNSYLRTKNSSVGNLGWACAGWTQVIVLRSAILEGKGTSGTSINTALKSGLSVPVAGIMLDYTPSNHTGFVSNPVRVFERSATGKEELAS